MIEMVKVPYIRAAWLVLLFVAAQCLLRILNVTHSRSFPAEYPAAV